MPVGDHMPPQPDWIARELRELRRRVDELAAARRAEATSISSGGWSVFAGGVEVLRIGDLGNAFVSPDGVRQLGLVLRRTDGTTALSILDGTPSDPFNQSLCVWDRSGNVVLSDDTESGEGIARPWIPLDVHRENVGTWDTTSSGTFGTLQRALGYKQHPMLHVYTQVTTDPGTAGEVQALCNGTQIGATLAVPAGGAGQLDVVEAVPAGVAFGDLLDVEIQARRTSGAGQVYIRTWFVYGRQT